MREITTLEQFDAWLGEPLYEPAAIQNLDLRDRGAVLAGLDAHDSLFLACSMEPLAAGQLVSMGAVVIPDLPGCFSAHRATLYRPEDLYDTYDPQDPASFASSLDQRVYREYLATGRDRPTNLSVSLARSLHDHAITAALDAELEGERVVAIMGGHGLERRDPMYREVVVAAKALAEQGYVLVSGGGPGAMEATHLGAWLAGRPDGAIDEVLASRFTARPPGAKKGKEYADPCWLARAWEVRERWPLVRDVKSIGIPTWLYGHEPPTPLATQIAKYFTNAIREEGLLAIAHHGVLFAPGSAGTTQEIFQDACQNHYGTPGLRSPMVLLGSDYWTTTRPVWPLLDAVSRDLRYGELVELVDTAAEAVRCIQRFEPSWYAVTSDPDHALETELRHDLKLRGNVVFHVEPNVDPEGAEGPLPSEAFADAVFEVLTDNWVDRAALSEALVHLGDARVHRRAGQILLERDGTFTGWRVELRD